MVMVLMVSAHGTGVTDSLKTSELGKISIPEALSDVSIRNGAIFSDDNGTYR